MSTGHRGAYIRGIDTLLRQDDGVDAGASQDCIANNLGHLWDCSHPTIVSIVTAAGLASAMRQDEPSAVQYLLVGRWPFVPWVQADGGSAKVIYRLGGYRSGGSGSVTFGLRIGTASIRPFLTSTSVMQATHTTSLTTVTTWSGSLYIPPAVMASTFVPQLISGSYSGSGTASEGVMLRTAWLELWCIYSGSKPSVRVSSLHARQMWRAP